MLVARRDPPFHAGSSDIAPPIPAQYAPSKAPRFTRFVTVIQLLGSLLAVPVGLASAYSFYHSNFSVEAVCRGLRGNIVAMLDKSVDAPTRRILVRRDVEAFERSCDGVDPDATAAFKTLLAADKAVPPVAGASVPAAEMRTQEPVRKAEPRPVTAIKQPAAKANPVATAAAPAARRDDPVSDAIWLDAVRQALVNRAPEPARASEPARTSSATQAPSAVSPKPQDISAPAVARTAPVAAPAVSAPVLPPPVTVSKTTAAPQPDTEHPVPPEAIPEPVPPDHADAAKAGDQGHSGVREWIAKIPLLGPVVDNGLH